MEFKIDAGEGISNPNYFCLPKGIVNFDVHLYNGYKQKGFETFF